MISQVSTVPVVPRPQADYPPNLPEAFSPKARLKAEERSVHNPMLPSFRGLSGRVGIFGGTFDPVHIAHIEGAELARKKMELDMVVFIPAARNPLKEKAPRATDTQRLEMLCEALSTEPGLFVCPMELESNSGKVSFTVETLRRIREEASPSIEICLIIGADVLPDFHRWREGHEIFRLVDMFACLSRDSAPGGGLASLKDRFDAGEIERLENGFINLKRAEISSTEIRNLLHRGEVPSNMLPESVLSFIIEEDLYRD